MLLSHDKHTHTHNLVSSHLPVCVCDRKSPAATRPRSDFSSSSPLLAGPLSIHSFLRPAPPRLLHPHRLSHHLTSKGPRRLSLFTLPSRRSLQKHQNKPCREAGRINDLPVPPVPCTPSETVPGHLMRSKYTPNTCACGGKRVAR